MQNNRYPLLEPGRVYHIYNRGNNSQDVFLADFERNCFLQRWKRYISPVADTYAYCLMKNHFHFAIKTKESIFRDDSGALEPLTVEEINRQFAKLFTSFAMALHAANETNGAVFKRRFQRGEILTDEQFRRLIAYILFNPQRHKVTQDCRLFTASSFQFLSTPAPDWLAVDELCRLFGGRNELELYLMDYQQQYFPPLILQ